MMNNEEAQRYSRQIMLPEIGYSGQQKLRDASVLMIGAGGLGCPVLQYLVAAGAGKIGIVDDDLVELSNLHRQILFQQADLGRPKAEVAKEKLMLLNPHVSITAYPVRFSPANATALCMEYDLVIDGSDNFDTRYLVNDTCVDLDKPLVFGSIFRFEGQVSVFNYLGGPEYRDLFPEPPATGSIPNCNEIGVLGVLPGIIGCHMANEALKIICGMGETLSGRLMTIDALTSRTAFFDIPKQDSRKQFSPSAELANMKNTNRIPELQFEQLNHWMQRSPDALCLIDVREAWEYEDHNMGGINIPLYELSQRIDEIPEHQKLVFCCQNGQRSKMAVQLLTPLRAGEMYSLKDGLR